MLIILLYLFILQLVILLFLYTSLDSSIAEYSLLFRKIKTIIVTMKPQSFLRQDSISQNNLCEQHTPKSMLLPPSQMFYSSCYFFCIHAINQTNLGLGNFLLPPRWFSFLFFFFPHLFSLLTLSCFL